MKADFRLVFLLLFSACALSSHIHAAEIIHKEGKVHIKLVDDVAGWSVLRPKGFEDHFDESLNDSGFLFFDGLSNEYTFGKSAGGEVPVWVDYGVGSNVTKRTDRLEYTANGAVYHDLSIGYNSTLEYKQLKSVLSVNGQPSKEIFVSFYVYVERKSGDLSRNVKLVRLSNGYTSSYDDPMFGVTLFPDKGNGAAYQYYGGTTHNTIWFDLDAEGKWLRFDYYLKLSSVVGASDGEFTLYINGERVGQKKDVVTSVNSDYYEWLTLPYYVAHDPGGEYVLYTDSVVVLPGYRRLEACVVKEFSQVESYSDCERPIVLNANYSEGANGEHLLSHPKFADKNTEKLLVFQFDDKNNIVGEGVRVCQRCPAL